MDDDLNTPQAMAALFDLAREINRGKTARIDVTVAQDTLMRLMQVLGMMGDRQKSPIDTDIAVFVDLLVDTRSELRATGQYALADKLRDALIELGITIEDGADGTKWHAE